MSNDNVHSSYDGDAGGSHGVSEKWVKDRVASGAKKASPERLGQFAGRMGSNASGSIDHIVGAKEKSPAMKKARVAGDAAHSAAKAKLGSSPGKFGGTHTTKRTKAGREFWSGAEKGAKESGWAKWKKGHGIGEPGADKDSVKSSYDEGDHGHHDHGKSCY
jgi:hypothetical protein